MISHPKVKQSQPATQVNLPSIYRSLTQLWEKVNKLKTSDNVDAITLNGKNSGAFEPKILNGTTSQFWRGDKTWQIISTTKGICFNLFNSDEAIYPSVGVSYFVVPPELNGYSISSVCVGVAIKGIGGTTTVNLRKQRGSVFYTVLSGPVSLGDVFHSENCTIDSSTKILATGDLLFVDILNVHTTVVPFGLSVSVIFSK